MGESPASVKIKRTRGKEFSLWYGDLSPDTDDHTLYECFASRYQVARTAEVLLDSAGFSKGYTFARFASEEEQKKCCVQMNGFKGLGSRPMKLSAAMQKTQWKSKDASMATAAEATPTTYDYTTTQSYYDASAWQTYSWPQQYYDTQDHASLMHSEYISESLNDLELIDHNVVIDVDEINLEVMNRDHDLWDAIENSKWTPVEIVA